MKTPPSKGPPTRKSPRNQKAGERKRGSVPVGRGGKIGKMGGGGRPSSTSSESESDDDDELNGGNDSNKGDECHRGHIGMQTSKTNMHKELLQMLREKEWTIKKLQGEIDCMKNKSKPSKKTLRQIMKWSGEEINFSESVNTFV